MSSIRIETGKTRFPTTPDLYGIFFEDINRGGDGGLYPELIRNRSFEDQILPEGCYTEDGGKHFISPTGWVEEFNGGEGMDRWLGLQTIEPTEVPGWYITGGSMTVDEHITLNAHRRSSLFVTFEKGGSLENRGYQGIGVFGEKGYDLILFTQVAEKTELTVSLEGTDGTLAEESLELVPGGWQQSKLTLIPTATDPKACLRFTAASGAKVRFGYTSLLPAETYMGHGLRKDIMEKFRDMKPKFLRFPGGCIVEGFTVPTAMRFKDTIGPAWERPSHWLMWHYNATNGLGFHEYLQLCEDLGLSPMYVCNCGITCQARKPYYFNAAEEAEMLDDTLAALEYALGSADTVWGRVRAAMGHPEPFGLKYLEIGNENNGPEYYKRYHLFRDTILKQYPDLIIVANERGPKDDPLPCDIADDHYYRTPEFFAENVVMYDDYDRNKPDIFVGEFAVTQTYEGQIRAAVGEAMYMVGLERNQDKVKLASFAPLLQNDVYQSWYPNLVVFDSLYSWAIPTYYCWKLFGSHRGDQVLESKEEYRRIPRKLKGLPGVIGTDGTVFSDMKLNGASAAPSHAIVGKWEEGTNGLTLRDDPTKVYPGRALYDLTPFTTLGEDTSMDRYTFETKVRPVSGGTVAMGILCAPKPLSYYDRTLPVLPDRWNMRYLEGLRWTIAGGTARVTRGTIELIDVVKPWKLDLPAGKESTLSCEVSDSTVRLYVDGELQVSFGLPDYPAFCSVATATDDTILIKAVNFSDAEDSLRITLDCDVKPDYTVYRLSGDPEATNTKDEREKVHDVTIAMSGASGDFTCALPPYSVNVIELKKA